MLKPQNILQIVNVVSGY